MNIIFVILRWLRMFHEIIFRTILYVDCAYNFPIEITVEPRGVRGQPRGLGRHHIAELAELALHPCSRNVNAWNGLSSDWASSIRFRRAEAQANGMSNLQGASRQMRQRAALMPLMLHPEISLCLPRRQIFCKPQVSGN